MLIRACILKYKMGSDPGHQPSDPASLLGLYQHFLIDLATYEKNNIDHSKL